MDRVGAGGALPRRRFGRTGVEVTALGLGGGALNDCYGRSTNDEWAAATVRRGLELGIRYFDTSAGYGESERRMGLGLAGWPRKEYFLATKTGTRAGTRDYSRDGTLRSVEESLRLLRTDYLDLLLIHDPDTLEPALAPDGALETMLRLKEEGVIRAIGLGVRSHEFHRRAIRDGRFDAILTYLDYTLVDQSARSLIVEAHEAGVAVVLGSPLATGFLSGRPVAEVAAEREMDAGHELVREAARVEQWARDQGESLARLALQFCLQEPRVSVTLAAARTPDEVEANVAALSPVPEEAWQALAGAGFEAGRIRLERAGLEDGAG
jgi:aryl-alcohol dehydrogenase-like predicted oxidoreductase